MEKIENKKSRRNFLKQLPVLAKAYGMPFSELQKEVLVQKVLDIVKYADKPQSILEAAESRVDYLRKTPIATPIPDVKAHR